MRGRRERLVVARGCVKNDRFCLQSSPIPCKLTSLYQTVYTRVAASKAASKWKLALCYLRPYVISLNFVQLVLLHELSQYWEASLSGIEVALHLGINLGNSPEKMSETIEHYLCTFRCYLWSRCTLMAVSTSSDTEKVQR